MNLCHRPWGRAPRHCAGAAGKNYTPLCIIPYFFIYVKVFPAERGRLFPPAASPLSRGYEKFTKSPPKGVDIAARLWYLIVRLALSAFEC